VNNILKTELHCWGRGRKPEAFFIPPYHISLYTAEEFCTNQFARAVWVMCACAGMRASLEVGHRKR
jgi:hypothetical protein